MLACLNMFAQKYSMINYLMLDVQAFPSLITRYQLVQLPTCILLNRKGEELARAEGNLSRSRLNKEIAEIYTKDIKRKTKVMERLNKWLTKWNKKTHQI
jgi:hypothetical protein